MILGVDGTRAVAPRTGVGRQLEYLLRAWSQHGMPFEQVRVFSHAPIDCLPEDERFSQELLTSDHPTVWWQARRLRRRAAETDVLFAPYTLPPGFPGKSVVSIFGIYEGRWRIAGVRARARSLHYAYSAHRASAVIANSSATKDDLVRHYRVPARKIEVIWPGRYEPFAPGGAGNGAAPFSDGRPYFLFVGKLSRRRNVPALIEAFASVVKERADYRLIIVGANTADVPVTELARRFGLQDALLHIEHVDHDRLGSLYRGARAFVLPTEHEGFSGTLPEAVSTGCAVMTVDHAALHDAGLEQGVWVLPDPRPATLGSALVRLATDDRWCAELRERALRCATTLPTMSDHAHAVGELIAAVAAGTAPRAR